VIWIFVALLVGWGNAGTSLLAPTTLLPGGSWTFVVSGIALTALALLVARRAGLDLRSLGVGRKGMWRGGALGLVAGIGIAVAGATALQIAPLITGRPVVYDPLLGVSAAALAMHIFLFLPLATVLPEEIAFRGTLLGLLRDSGKRAIVLSAAAFALWHGAVAVATVEQTTLVGTPLVIPAILGALAVVFAGGVVLAWLRISTGTLASTVAAHWSFNATLLVALWALLPRSAGSA
jgi:membrane protease YdiL (CAAX protease family)